MRALVGVAVVFCIACSSPARNVAEFRPLQTGDTVPHYASASLRGDTVRLGGAEAVTVLNVWATWCTSCREEMSDLEALSREFSPRGVRVVGEGGFRSDQFNGRGLDDDVLHDISLRGHAVDVSDDDLTAALTDAGWDAGRAPNGTAAAPSAGVFEALIQEWEDAPR